MKKKNLEPIINITNISYRKTFGNKWNYFDVKIQNEIYKKNNNQYAICNDCYK